MAWLAVWADPGGDLQHGRKKCEARVQLLISLNGQTQQHLTYSLETFIAPLCFVD